MRLVRDLLVVGGGPVGLATALYADRAGLSVSVVEPRTGPIDKACGEGLMPGAVSALSDLGIPVTGHPLRGIRYTNGRQSAEAFFRGEGFGVRRTALHQALRSGVDDADIPVLARAADRVEQDQEGVAAAGLRARYLAVADGLHSPVRRQLGIGAAAPARAPRYGLRQHYAMTPWTDLVEVHWGDRSEAYVTPVGRDLVGVAVLTSERAPYGTQLKSFPELVRRLPPSAVTSTRGAGPLLQRTSRRVSGRVLLVGDAAGYVDALTGEGISVGLASARALVGCVLADDPASYEQKWRAASRRYRWITSALLRARGNRYTAPLIVPAAQRLPQVFAACVNQLAK